MPPRRKRKTQVGAYSRKKKDQEQEQDEEQQDQKEEQEVAKRSSSDSGSDHDEDDVCLISPPPTNTPVMLTGKKRGRKGKPISTQKAKTIDFLTQNMQPVVLPFNTHMPDLPKHEAVFQKLGLWEFANLEFDLEPRPDELAQMVMTYDSGSHSSTVKDCKIRVTRADLARALRIPYKKDKNSITLEIPNFKGSPAYPIKNRTAEGIRAVLHFISTRVCVFDDPSLTTEEIAALVDSALKLEQSVDWAGYIWARAESDLMQGKGLEKFYYGLHFQQLIRHQKPNLLDRESTEVENEDGDLVVKTRTLQDLDDGSADNDDAEVPEGCGVSVDEKQEEGLHEKVENGENEGNEGKVVRDDTLEQEKGEEDGEVNNNETEESMRDDEGDVADNHGNVGLPEGILRPCSTDIEGKKEPDEDNKDLMRMHTDNAELSEPLEVDSQGAQTDKPDPAENAVTELDTDAVTDLYNACLEKPASPAYTSQDGVYIEKPPSPAYTSQDGVYIEKSPSPAYTSQDGVYIEKPPSPAYASQDGVYIEKPASPAYTSQDGVYIEKPPSPECPLSESEKGMMPTSVAHPEKSVQGETQFIDGDKDTILNSTDNLGKTTSMERAMREIEKGITLSPGTHIQGPSSAEHLMPEIEKDMTLNSGLHLQRPSSAENLLQMLHQGPSNFRNARKRMIDEDSELHVDPTKKARSGVPLNFEDCMENMYEWARRAETSWGNEKHLLIMENQQLSDQLQHRECYIQNLKVNSQQQQVHLRLEIQKVNSQYELVSKTFFGYTKAMEEARETIQHLREIIRQQNSTIESLNHQLQQERQSSMAYQYLKEQCCNLNQHVQETYEKLKNKIDKSMEKQVGLEKELDVLKAGSEKEQSDPPA